MLGLPHIVSDADATPLQPRQLTGWQRADSVYGRAQNSRKQRKQAATGAPMLSKMAHSGQRNSQQSSQCMLATATTTKHSSVAQSSFESTCNDDDEFLRMPAHIFTPCCSPVVDALQHLHLYACLFFLLHRSQTPPAVHWHVPCLPEQYPDVKSPPRLHNVNIASMKTNTIAPWFIHPPSLDGRLGLRSSSQCFCCAVLQHMSQKCYHQVCRNIHRNALYFAALRMPPHILMLLLTGCHRGDSPPPFRPPLLFACATAWVSTLCCCSCHHLKLAATARPPHLLCEGAHVVACSQCARSVPLSATCDRHIYTVEVAHKLLVDDRIER
jgi:hypothetical protein